MAEVPVAESQVAGAPEAVVEAVPFAARGVEAGAHSVRPLAELSAAQVDRFVPHQL